MMKYGIYGVSEAKRQAAFENRTISLAGMCLETICVVAVIAAAVVACAA